MRQIQIHGDTAYVPLTKSYVAVVDADDVHLVREKLWYARVVKPGLVYAVRHEYTGGRQTIVLMHRVIAGTAEGFQTDHVDMNGLNNRRANLRTATHSQNQHNRTANSLSTSGYKGVSWDKASGRWIAKIKCSGKSFTLGRFDSAEAAHDAYSTASKKMHGVFSNTLTTKEKAPDLSTGG